jgi:hypothetical protein
MSMLDGGIIDIARNQSAAAPSFRSSRSHLARFFAEPSTLPIKLHSIGLIPTKFRMLRLRLFTLCAP